MPEFAAALAAQDPDAAALVDVAHGVRLGWGEVDRILNQTANNILAADLGPAARIAVFAENGAETALAHLGGLLGGASTVPVNFHLTADEAAYILDDSQTSILFVGPETAERGIAAAREAGVGRVVCWGDPTTGTVSDASVAGSIGRAGNTRATQNTETHVVSWDAWLAEGSTAHPPIDVVPRPNLLYTSGTTGRPKGTELPPTQFKGGQNMAEHLEGLATARFAQYGPHLVVGPMYHTGPLSGMRILVAGTSSVILGRFDAEATLAAIETHRTRSAVMVPTHFVRLLALPDEVKARYDVSSMELVTHTGAKCPEEVKRAMIDWWGPCFVEAYGASEVGTTCSINSTDWLAHPGSVGKAVPPFEALVVDDDDQPVGPNTEGRLYFKDATGRGIEYHNDPEKSAAAHLEPGVFTLGEIGYVDDDGFVFITDRFSDMVVSGGVNLYPAEAENVIIEHPAVADVACIGVPHPEMGEELRALVVLEPTDPAGDASNQSNNNQNPDALADEITGFCRERLSTYKCPRSIEFVDTLGRNTMGKVNKRTLRAPYWD